MADSELMANVVHVSLARMRAWYPFMFAVLLSSCGSGEVNTPTSPSPSPSLSPGAVAPTINYQVSGTVRDGEGAPVGGASVFVGVISKWPTPRFSTTTDATGTFRGDLPSGSYQVLVTKPGFEDVFRSVSVSGDTVFDLTIRAGIYIVGKVLEVGVGPLDDVTVEVISGPGTGRSTLTGHPIAGQYLLDHLLPGDLTLRASKAGYETLEQTVRAMTNIGNIDFSLKWAYGTCLQSVTPVSFAPYPSAGGIETVTVSATAGRRWTVTPDSPWMELLSPATQTGSGQVMFRVLSNPAGPMLPRRGALMIRCSGSEGQNVWVNQNPACQVRLESAPDSPAVFGADGGIGHLLLHVGTPSCRWQFTSQTDWIRTNGISQWSGDLSVGVFFVVSSNATGMERTGTIVVGETPWQVTQRR
jgi:hypothetical protein